MMTFRKIITINLKSKTQKSLMKEFRKTFNKNNQFQIKIERFIKKNK